MGRDLLAEGGVFAAKPAAQLERLEALAVQFGGAAHDVCNLLGAIRLTTQDALRRPESDALKELLLEILACVDQATDVVCNNGVDSLADEGEVDLVDLVTSRRRVLRRIAGRRVDLAMRFSSVPPIYGSPTSIAQAITNLVKNAAEAMGNQEGRITVSTRMHGDHVLLEVEDDGPGFDADVRARACEAFFTTKQAGRGLGLALVRQIALVHGAQLEIDSEPGRGSVVRLRFLPAT